jgi:hypothetical protein
MILQSPFQENLRGLDKDGQAAVLNLVILNFKASFIQVESLIVGLLNFRNKTARPVEIVLIGEMEDRLTVVYTIQ